jgi:hypothetical protein
MMMMFMLMMIKIMMMITITIMVVAGARRAAPMITTALCRSSCEVLSHLAYYGPALMMMMLMMMMMMMIMMIVMSSQGSAKAFPRGRVSLKWCLVPGARRGRWGVFAPRLRRTRGQRPFIC